MGRYHFGAGRLPKRRHAILFEHDARASTALTAAAMRATPLSGSFERGHVDDETIFHIAPEHAFVGVVDLLYVDHLDI